MDHRAAAAKIAARAFRSEARALRADRGAGSSGCRSLAARAPARSRETAEGATTSLLALPFKGRVGWEWCLRSGGGGEHHPAPDLPGDERISLEGRGDKRIASGL